MRTFLIRSASRAVTVRSDRGFRPSRHDGRWCTFGTLGFSDRGSRAAQTPAAVASAARTAQVTAHAFTGTANLSVTGPPSGATALFENPASVSASASTALPIRFVAVIPPETYSLNLVESAETTRTIPLDLTTKWHINGGYFEVPDLLCYVYVCGVAPRQFTT